MNAERRDLARVSVVGANGNAAITKGGLIRLDGSLEVPFAYRDVIYSVSLPDAIEVTAVQVQSVIEAALVGIDEALQAAELIGAEV